MNYLNGSKPGIDQELVAVFDSEPQLLSYVKAEKDGWVAELTEDLFDQIDQIGSAATGSALFVPYRTIHPFFDFCDHGTPCNAVY